LTTIFYNVSIPRTLKRVVTVKPSISRGGKEVREGNTTNDFCHVFKNPEGGVYKMRSKWSIAGVVALAVAVMFLTAPYAKAAPKERKSRLGLFFPCLAPLLL
jgi:hypothetical protein